MAAGKSKAKARAGRAGDLASLKAKAAELLSQDRSRLLFKMPFIGSLLLRLEPVPVKDPRLPTAATDGDHVFVDIDFYSSLSPEERLFVLAHETWHCALIHFVRRQGRDRELFNIAADLEIHFLLTAEGLKAPFVLPHDPEWKGLSCEEIYDKYPRDPAEAAGLGGGKDSEHIKSGQSGDGAGFDRHVQKGSLGEDGKELEDSDDPGGGEGGADPDFTPGIAPGAEERCRERIAAAIQQYQRTKGDLPGDIKGRVEAVLKPELDWRELLAQFVTSCYGGSRRWLPPSRRHVWQGLYLQSQRHERLRAVVAVDTSGSTLGDLPRFFTELTALLGTFGQYELTVIQCDARVQAVERFDDSNPLPPDRTWEMHGGGGTDFRPVFEYVEEHPEVDPAMLLFFTDGYGSYPDRPPPYPVLWLLTSDGKCGVEWGQQVCFKDGRAGFRE